MIKTKTRFTAPTTKHFGGNGADFCRKRNTKGKYASRTPGSQKNENCQASDVDRHMAKCSRSYKDKGYSSWSAKVSKRLR